MRNPALTWWKFGLWFSLGGLEDGLQSDQRPFTTRPEVSMSLKRLKHLRQSGRRLIFCTFPRRPSHSIRDWGELDRVGRAEMRTLKNDCCWCLCSCGMGQRVGESARKNHYDFGPSRSGSKWARGWNGGVRLRQPQIGRTDGRRALHVLLLRTCVHLVDWLRNPSSTLHDVILPVSALLKSDTWNTR